MHIYPANQHVPTALPFKSVMSDIIRAEYEGMVKYYTSDESKEVIETTAGNGYANKNKLQNLGTVLHTIDFKNSSCQELVKQASYANKDAQCLLGVEPLFKAVTEKIIMLDGTHTFDECLAIGEHYIKALGKHFYGMLIRSSKGKLLNPYHPVTALTHSNSPITGNFSIVIYLYNDRDHMDLFYGTAAVPVADTKKSVELLMQTYLGGVEETKVTYSTAGVFKHYADHSISLATARKVPITFTLDSSLETRSRNGTNLADKECIMVQHQVLAKGTVAPFYGTSLLLRDDSQSHSVGLHIGMQRSVNISSSGDEPTWDKIITGSVCTGATNGISDASLATLNHANLNSPYNTRVCAVGCLSYIEWCIFYSRALYAKSKQITLDNLVEPQQVTITTANLEKLKIATSTDHRDQTLPYFNEYSRVRERFNALLKITKPTDNTETTTSEEPTNDTRKRKSRSRTTTADSSDSTSDSNS